MMDEGKKFLSKDNFGFLLCQECKRAERYSHYFGLICFEFKGFNLEDSFLPLFSKLIVEVTRETDILGHLQDKKPALLCHNVDDQDLKKIVDRIQPNIPLFIRDIHRKGSVTIGGACFPTHATTAKELEIAVRENNF